MFTGIAEALAAFFLFSLGWVSLQAFFCLCVVRDYMGSFANMIGMQRAVLELQTGFNEDWRLLGCLKRASGRRGRGGAPILQVQAHYVDDAGTAENFCILHLLDAFETCTCKGT